MLIALILILTAASVATAAEKPNVVLIISDDAGWADYGFMRNATAAADPGGRGAIPTPNLDQLASMGVTFTNAYTASVCSPSRAMITTGQYGTRFGYGSNILSDATPINNAAVVQGLPTSAVTVWERMQSAGYKTAAIGKWHIGEHADGGGQLGNRPENQGVEHFEGIWAGSRGYFVNGETGSQALRRTISDGAGGVASTSVVESQYAGQYVTDVFGDQSEAYIRSQAASGSSPFFLYTSFTAPHTPLQATPSDLTFIDSLNEPGLSGQRRTYAAMQYAMDRNVGKILSALNDPNNDGDSSDSIAENTLVLFINDNGGDCCDVEPNSSDNGALRNGKGSQFDGGLRVPMIVAGAGVNASARGIVSQQLVHAVDLVPTAFAGAGGGAFGQDDVVDGVNLLPHINGVAQGAPHDHLFLPRYNNQQSALRMGRWKYIYQNGAGYQLYDLENDPGESNNLVASPENEQLVQELHGLLTSYHVEIDKPRHDNQAPVTNQFDHFRFRAESFANAVFSTADAWVDGDHPGAPQTASWRDGYANNRMTFPAKESGDYTVINDLYSAGGIAYIANRISLASAAGPLAGQHTAEISGLPILMAANRAGEPPVIDLSANDALPQQFTFQFDAGVELYDDLLIQGDGNQRFLFGGQLRELRAGCNVTKTGAAGVTFEGGIDLSGTLDLQGGHVTFTEGTLRGNVLVRSGVVLQVGPSGIAPGETSESLEIVLARLDLNYDAALDISGDGVWSDAAAPASNLTFASPAATSPVDSSVYPQLSASYSIPSSGGAAGLNNYFEQAGPRSRQDATFEVVFRVTDDNAGSDQVLFEVGGADRGVAFILNDGQLTFNVDGDSSDINLATDVSVGWRHAVGVIDLSANGDTVSLYLDNQLVGALGSQTIGDWAGGNPLGLGAGASSVTGVSAGSGQSFHGEIAVARYYSDTAFTATDVAQNHLWLQQSPSPIGQPAVSLMVEGDFTMQTGARLLLDLLSTAEFDRVESTGSLQLDGELEIAASEGFAPTAGQAFRLVTADTLSGEFQAVALPSLPVGLMWQLKYSTTELSLLVTLAGDYNGDGEVDASDYTVWRDALGQAVSPGLGADGNGDGLVSSDDYEIWRANFGATLPGAVAETAAPTPDAASMTLLGSLLLSAHTRRN